MISLLGEGVARAVLAISFTLFLQYMNWAPGDRVKLVIASSIFTHVMIGLTKTQLGFVNEYVDKNK